MNVTGTLGGLQLEPFTIPFLEKPLENAVDVTTLDFGLYTDFVNQKRQWTLNWALLDESEYNDLRAVYDSQFITNAYPIFVVPYYGINVSVRMYINDKDIRKDGCDIRNVEVILVEAPIVDSSVGDSSVG